MKKNFFILSKKETIEEHRKMWNWIAERLTAENGKNIDELKFEYCEQFADYAILNQCFCCQYVENHMNDDEPMRCDLCPLEWGTENQVGKYFCEKGLVGKPLPFEEEYGHGLWLKAMKAISEYKDYELAREIAKQIAELPEKK